MPFGLKNVGATYQRLITQVFKHQLGRNMEAYVDDMIVKSQQPRNHLNDLGETFDRLRFYGMKLNPAKCTFWASMGKFLGYLISKRGIEANPDKVQAIMDMQPPATVKEVQKLAGRVAALGCFLPRSADRCNEFFKVLKSPEQFAWND